LLAIYGSEDASLMRIDFPANQLAIRFDCVALVASCYWNNARNEYLSCGREPTCTSLWYVVLTLYCLLTEN